MTSMSIGLITFFVVFAFGFIFMILSMVLSKGTKRLARKGMDLTKKLRQDGNDMLEEMTDEMFEGHTKAKHRHTKKCPYCDSNIDSEATKCENCGAQQQ